MSARAAALRNAAITSVATYAESGLGLLVGVIVARTLGPESFGHYTFAVWICGWLVVAANNALTTSSIKFLAEARGEGDESLAQSLGARLVRFQTASCGVVLLAFVLCAMAVPLPEWEGMLMWMLPLTVLAVWSRAGFWMRGAIAKGHERFEPENIAVLVAGALQLAAIILWAMLDRSLVGAFAIFAISGVLMNIVVQRSMVRLRIIMRPGVVPDDLARRVNRHLFLTGVLVVVGLGANRTIEMLLLKGYSTPEALGFLAIAATLTKGAVDLLSGGMSSVLLPAMAKAFVQGGSRSVGRIASEAIRYYWFLGLAVAGGGLILSEGAIRIIYGNGYADAADAVAWMLVIGGLGAWQSSINALQISTDQQGRRILVGLAALLVNVAAGVMLIPPYGLTGAIGSIAITRLFGVIVTWQVATRACPFEMPWNSMFRLGLASAIGWGIATLAGKVMDGAGAFVVQAVVFALTYASASILLRAWTDEDFGLLGRFARRLGQFGGTLERGVAFLRRRFADSERR